MRERDEERREMREMVRREEWSRILPLYKGLLMDWNVKWWILHRVVERRGKHLLGLQDFAKMATYLPLLQNKARVTEVQLYVTFSSYLLVLSCEKFME